MRAVILDVADELFRTYGEDVSFDEIAVTSGISATQLRTYFTSTAGIRRTLDMHRQAPNTSAEPGTRP